MPLTEGSTDLAATERATMTDAAEARAQELECLRSMYEGELRELDGGALLEVDIPISLADEGVLVACGAQSARVRHLALVLRVGVSPNYPLTSAPDFALVSAWLDARTHARLLSELIAEWEAVREPILVGWVERLRAEAAEGLVEIVLEDVECGWQPSTTPVAGGVLVREPSDVRGAFAALLAEDARRVAASTGTQIVRCGICLCNMIYSDFVPFTICSHLFCSACLKTDLEGRIEQGDAAALSCPQCRAALLPNEVQRLVAPALFAQYESRQLQSSLAGMEDICWCPLAHCQAAVIMDCCENGQFDQLGRCPQCAHSFCILCRGGWHGHGPCNDFKAKFDAASPAEREVLEARFGSSVIAEMHSNAWIASATQPCPGCRGPIEKNGGCNHITCSKCKHEWCWLCRGKYTPEHFMTTACNVFSSDFFREVARAIATEAGGDWGTDEGEG
ncbi:hypothetical protein T492DRAFT_1001394 [Pavlovales sp. CCMP2436]|nr:hypothetical protein T492DRAFT_1001394 [Pavlovales sp. CCMP2436]